MILVLFSVLLTLVLSGRNCRVAIIASWHLDVSPRPLGESTLICGPKVEPAQGGIPENRTSWRTLSRPPSFPAPSKRGPPFSVKHPQDNFSHQNVNWHLTPKRGNLGFPRILEVLTRGGFCNNEGDGAMK